MACAEFTAKCACRRTLYFDKAGAGYAPVQAILECGGSTQVCTEPRNRVSTGTPREIQAAVRGCDTCNTFDPQEQCVFQFVPPKK